MRHAAAFLLATAGMIGGPLLAHWHQWLGILVFCLGLFGGLYLSDWPFDRKAKEDVSS